MFRISKKVPNKINFLVSILWGTLNQKEGLLISVAQLKIT